MTPGVSAMPVPDTPPVCRCGTVTSALDVAFCRLDEGALPPWGSVLAERQTSGRGQLRRFWHSPPGNVYAALRLPVTPPFDGTAAAVATGVLTAEALGALGWRVLLKWPNDLVLLQPSGPCKVAGILLEERGGALVAGIGINVASAPQAAELRPDAALPAACLADGGAANRPVPPAGELWDCLVRHMVSAYSDGRRFAASWRGRAEALLLWRERAVVVSDGAECRQGRLCGLWPSGALCLETADGRVECLGGSLRPA